MNKKDFVIREFLQFSINAGFSTRNADYPVYDYASLSLESAKSLKKDVRHFLLSECIELNGDYPTEAGHIRRIEAFSKKISQKHGGILHKKKFRIGTSQKIINLFLKYLWSVNLINEPLHCPFDNIVKQKIKKYASSELVDWTEMKNIKEYMVYVSAAQEVSAAENLTIATWEMKHWKRR